MSVSEFTKISEPQYVKAQVTFERTSGLTEDRVVNDFYFVCQEAEDFTGPIKTALLNAYAEFGSEISGDIARGTGASSFVKFYDLSIAAPNPPFDTQNLGFNTSKNPSNVDLPPEVSLVLSFTAPIVSGTNPKRRRGRIYTPPLSVGSASTDNTTPSATLCAEVRQAGQVLLNASDASLIWQWAIFSPTTAGGWYTPGGSGPPNLAAAVSPVASGWCDNAWDIQRRRGVKATTRYPFS